MASRTRVKLEAATEERLQNMLEFYEALPEHVALLQEMETRLMASFEDLTNAVRHNSDVTRSAVAMIRGLAGKIASSGTDPGKLAELVNDLNKNAGELADAITANTVAESTSDPAPTIPEPVVAEPEAPAAPDNSPSPAEEVPPST